MYPHHADAAQNQLLPTPGSKVAHAIEQLYRESAAPDYNLTPHSFNEFVMAALTRYAADADEPAQLELLALLHMEELTLARACSAGDEKAWNVFIARFRAPLFATAFRLTRDEARARELADELNAELYGIPNTAGRRISKLDYYMGRGSLEGWLRTVLARQHIDRCRAHSKEVSLEEQMEDGAAFTAPPQPAPPATDNRVNMAIAQSLGELDEEERFLLASYFLDERTLADIARQICMHESTVSRKLDKLTGALRKRVKKRLMAAGVEHARCNELLHDLDVRDIDVDVRKNLQQERSVGSF